MYATRAFFGTDRVTFDLINASNATREYDRFTDVLDDTIDARIWLGIHFRFADTQGAWLGKKVGQWVAIGSSNRSAERSGRLTELIDQSNREAGRNPGRRPVPLAARDPQ